MEVQLVGIVAPPDQSTRPTSLPQRSTGPVFRSIATGTDGSFRAADLPAGFYTVCASQTGSDYVPNCVWGRMGQVVVKSGSQSTVPIRMDVGRRVRVRFDGPLGRPTAARPDIVVGLSAAKGGPRFLRLVSATEERWDYEMSAPADIPLEVSVHSTRFNIDDHLGRRMGGPGATRIKLGPGGSPAAPAFNFRVVGLK